MKSVKFYVMILATVVLGLSSCLKDKGYDNLDYGLNSDGNNFKPSVKILQGGSGAGDFKKLDFSNTSNNDSMQFNAYYVDPTTNDPKAPAAINVTMGVDDAFITAYNANPNNKLKYDRLPDSTFTFTQTSTSIPQGGVMSPTVKVFFKPNKIDGGKIYMLPIVIKTASGGVEIQKNYGYIVFNKIGNPLAGTYTLTTGSRYNCTVPGDQGWAPQAGWAYPTALVIPANYAAAAIPSPKVLEAVGPTTVTVYVANLGAGTSRDYFLEIDPSVTAVTNVDVTLTSTFDAGISNIRWFQKTYDPVNKRFILLWTYNNLAAGAGSDRIIYEVLTKQ